MHTTSIGDLWLLGCWGQGNTITSCHSSGHTHEVHQVPGHCFHLWQTEPHFSEVLCKGSAVKSWTFIGHHWMTVFLVSFVVSCVFFNTITFLLHSQIQLLTFQLNKKSYNLFWSKYSSYYMSVMKCEVKVLITLCNCTMTMCATCAHIVIVQLHNVIRTFTSHFITDIW